MRANQLNRRRNKTPEAHLPKAQKPLPLEAHHLIPNVPLKAIQSLLLLLLLPRAAAAADAIAADKSRRPGGAPPPGLPDHLAHLSPLLSPPPLLSLPLLAQPPLLHLPLPNLYALLSAPTRTRSPSPPSPVTGKWARSAPSLPSPHSPDPSFVARRLPVQSASAAANWSSSRHRRGLSPPPQPSSSTPRLPLAPGPEIPPPAAGAPSDPAAGGGLRGVRRRVRVQLRAREVGREVGPETGRVRVGASEPVERRQVQPGGRSRWCFPTKAVAW
ncbi:uncharacterized protein A4U43_C08F810 [Asparagus officinalis]|nr:uncharacterized protein A4U43_C08F810 [Asparagus officinalis]